MQFLRLHTEYAIIVLYRTNASTSVIRIQIELLIADIVVIHADGPLLYYARRACSLAGLGTVSTDNDAVPLHVSTAYRPQEDAVVVELLEVVLIATLDGALGPREGQHLGYDLGEEAAHQGQVGVDDGELRLENCPQQAHWQCPCGILEGYNHE